MKAAAAERPAPGERPPQDGLVSFGEPFLAVRERARRLADAVLPLQFPPGWPSRNVDA